MVYKGVDRIAKETALEMLNLGYNHLAEAFMHEGDDNWGEHHIFDDAERLEKARYNLVYRHFTHICDTIDDWKAISLMGFFFLRDVYRAE